MKVTEDVIKDLYPLFQEGELSEDSKKLILAYFADHPELKESLTQNELDINNLSLPEIDIEIEIVKRTKSFIRWRSICLGFAIFFTASTFAISRTSYGNWSMIEDNPVQAAISFSIGSILWIIYYRMGKRLK